MTDNQQDNQQATTEDVPVVLRVWRNGGGVFALFPTLSADYRPRVVQRATALMHGERKAEARRVYAAMRAG